jgi:hypothetical protein
MKDNLQMIKSHSRKYVNLLSSFLSDRVYLGLRHRMTMGRWPSYTNPRHFNENILCLMLSQENAALRKTISDKVGVRHHVEKLVGKKHLTECYAIWDGTGPFPFDELPDSFVVKPSHASGAVRIVTDKSSVDPEELQATCRKWLAIDFEKAAREYVYAGMPHNIMFEELLIDPVSGSIPCDYKFYVFYGVVRLVECHTEKPKNHKVTFFDQHWNMLPVKEKTIDPGPYIERPENMAEMIELSQKLSEGLNFIRVDLYDLGDRILFGELTNFPGGGNQHFDSNEFDAYLGQFFDPELKTENIVPFVS